MLRRRVLAGLFTAALLATAGCSGSGDSGGDVTLTYGVWDKNQVPAMEKIATEFTKAHPTVKVKVELTPNKEYWTKLQTAVTGGSAPDVFWMNAPRFGLYASSGVLAPMDSKADLSKYPKSLVDTYNWQGRQYALPKDFDTIGLWYNKALFDAAGVKYPDETWTWETLTEAAKKLTDPAKGQFGIAAPAYSQENYYNTIFQSGGTVVSADRKKSGYEDPATVKGLQFWVDLINRHKVSPTVKQMSDTEPTQLFTSGKVAMMYGGSWEAVGFAKDDALKGKIDVAVLPRGDKRAVVIHGLGNVVYAKSKHPKEALEFATFLGSEQAHRIQAETGTVIPAYEGTQATWVGAMPQYQLKAFLDELPYAVAYPISKNTAGWADQERKLLPLAWDGSRDLPGVAKELATAMNAALAKE
ncbi:sugar ABC transporter substrate-binding protein [Longispora sp. NPDC051575]|uniref:ABC transporter substrate-binding protein n=1 Tax=Longispora sp. NPDC051575 TaxID=3154943 RepID=UPI00343DA69A